MNDTQLSGLIQRLPRTSASPAFTSEVMRRVARPERHPSLAWRLAAGVAMAACLTLVAQLALIRHSQNERVEQLRAEQAKLAAELAAVKRIAEETQPVVVLENGRGTRVIVDVDSAIQPASLRTYD